MTTLLTVLIIASLVAVVQARANSGRATFARLARAQTEALAELAVRERLRPIVAEALTSAAGAARVPLDGTAFRLAGPRYSAEVRLNDIGGLVDLYFAPDSLIAALPDPSGLAVGRATALAALVPGERFPLPVATLAHFGLDRAARITIGPLLTQSGGPGALNGPHVPPTLRAAVEALGLSVDAAPVAAVVVNVTIHPGTEG